MDDGKAAKIHVNEYITDQSYPLTEKSMRSSSSRCISGLSLLNIRIRVYSVDWMVKLAENVFGRI